MNDSVNVASLKSRVTEASKIGPVASAFSDAACLALPSPIATTGRSDISAIADPEIETKQLLKATQMMLRFNTSVSVDESANVNVVPSTSVELKFVSVCDTVAVLLSCNVIPPISRLLRFIVSLNSRIITPTPPDV